MTPMIRRTPSYSVTTFALVLIAVAAFGLRYAARFLPERQPNLLKSEYGEYVRRSMRETVEWHPFGTEAFTQARDRGKIVFLDVGTVMSLSAKRFSEDYATDGEYRRLLHDHFEPIKIDALEMPWIIDALSVELPPFPSAERFLAVTTDHQGGIVEGSAIRPQSGDNSLSAWLEGLARLRYADPGEVARRANESLATRRLAATATLAPGPCNADIARTWAGIWEQAGVVQMMEGRVLPVTTLPMELLAMTGADQAGIGALNLMLQLALSPAFDPIDGGFFLSTVGPEWRQPIASKLTGHSLLVAAAFAELGREYDVPLFAEIARKTVDWARARRVNGMFEAGLGTDQGLSDFSPYYSVDEADVEELPFFVGATGFPRIQALGGFAGNVTAQRTRQVFAAAEEIRAVRVERTPPRKDAGQYADQNGQAISGLFRIGRALEDADTIRLAADSYAATKAMLVQPLGDVMHAPTGTGRATGYCGDYVWMARAAIDGYLATGDDDLLEDARRFADRTLELFRGESGALMCYLPSLLGELGYGFEVYRADDTEVPSANALAARNLADLASLTGVPKYQADAEGIIRAFSGQFADGAAPVGMVMAALRLYEARVTHPATR